MQNNHSRRHTARAPAPLPAAGITSTARQPSALIALCLLWTLLAPLSCAQTAAEIGRWQRVGGTGSLVLRPDGTFTATDDMGGITEGRYRIDGHGYATFQVTRSNILREALSPVTPPQTVNAWITVRDDLLEVSESGDSPHAAERYRRVITAPASTRPNPTE